MDSASAGLLERVKTKIKAHTASIKHGQPSRNVRVVFVVGADGAESTIAYLAAMLRASGERVGIITQNYVQIGDEQVKGSDKADVTGDAERLQGLLAHMARAKCGFALIEIPPELPHHQYVGIKPALVIVRRCGDEFTDQATLKARLVMLNNLFARTPEYVVFNRDDPCSGELVKLSEVEGVISFGTHKKAECRISNVQLHRKGSAIDLTIDLQTPLSLVTTIPGKQAIYSATAAAAAAYVLHVPIESIESGAEQLTRLPASLEYIPVERPYNVVVDGASTPGGLEETLESLKHFTANRLIVVLGAPLGLRIAERPVLGEVAAKYADRLIVVDGEFTADQNPQQVREQILQGVLAVGAEARTDDIADRRAGIEKAVSIARRGDTVVIAASGVRPYRQLGGTRVTWSDHRALQELFSA